MVFFFFQAEDGIRDLTVTGVQTCALPISLLAFSALNYLPVLLSLTLFITVLMTLSRSYRESEMVIWFGSGLSLLAWIRPVLLFAAPLVALVAVLALFLSPWAIGKAEEDRRP